jgi:hypothetical protein
MPCPTQSSDNDHPPKRLSCYACFKRPARKTVRVDRPCMIERALAVVRVVACWASFSTIGCVLVASGDCTKQLAPPRGLRVC